MIFNIIELSSLRKISYAQHVHVVTLLVKVSRLGKIDRLIEHI